MDYPFGLSLAGVRVELPLDGLRPCVFVQVKPGHAELALSIEPALQVGVVYTLNGRTTRTLRDLTALTMARTGDLSGVLVDAAQYAGNTRDPAGRPLDPAWIREQFRCGLAWALTDSGYLDNGDVHGLAAILHGADRLGRGVIATLPIHKSWLSRRADEVAEAVRRVGVPVALLVEDRDDPFGVISAVEGLIHLLEVDVPILLLRSDISAVGAVAFGATAGAVGATTGLRHIYPRTDTHKPRPRQPLPAAVVRRVLAYKQLHRIAEASHVLPDRTIWECNCTVCYGRWQDWIIDETDAFAHSAAVLADLASEVLAQQDSAIRRASWLAHCRHALSVGEEVHAKLEWGWRPPAFLKAWLRAGVRASQPALL